MSRVDVIVPCYRYGHFLRECVASILTQTGVDVRVLVIDDASPDDSAEIASDIAAADARVTFRRHSLNRGHIATYNEGLAWADGDYVLLLSADDTLTPGALARAACLLDAHPRVGLAYGRARRTRDPARETFVAGLAGVAAVTGARIVPGSEWIAGICATGQNAVPSAAALVRTSLQQRVGGYRPELPHAGDMEMWLRLAAHGPVAVLDAEQACHRVHATNMSSRYPGLADLRQRRACFARFFAGEYANLVPESRRLRDLALSRLARDAMRQASRRLSRGDLKTAGALLGFAASAAPAELVGYPWERLARELRRA